ncbi:Alpha/beta-Hydrolases superfamily protein, putative [Theobroma cacao]|uniref:Phospholipase A1 n=1 Tax=Theobroma cacao TaxID=3641 RepID=A0A061GLT6_THECC|nr:Alpha/beta-Hydrolases superfamily protein, putative [Theobroma cacao]
MDFFGKKKKLMGSIAQRWRELSGENNWEGLLDPLDKDLRKYIIHYGERTQAVMDAFNGEKASKWVGFSRYSTEDFFSKVGLEMGNPYKYKVTKFFYARSEIQILDWFAAVESNWIGYVAVTTDEGKAVLGRRDILICWRGTMRNLEVINDIKADLVSAADILGDNGDPKVHHGWHSIYTAKDSKSVYNQASAREQVLSEVRRLVDLYQDEEISITLTGHSLGGAVATLNAVDIIANGYNKSTTKPDKEYLVTAFVFASPRVGDSGFKKVFSGLKNLHVLRIKNELDMVPSLPIPLPLLHYTHVGEKLLIDSHKSPYMKSHLDISENLVIAHQLEPYLHGVAGSQGAKGEFKLEVNRDIALLNKSLDALKDEYKVPVEWWIEKNKGMAQQDDGSWILDDHEPEPAIV